MDKNNHDVSAKQNLSITRHAKKLTKKNDKLYNLKIEFYDDGKSRLISYKNERVKPLQYQSKTTSIGLEKRKSDELHYDNKAYIFEVRRRIQQYARNNDFKYFVTLTFDPKLIEDDNDNYRFEALKKWLHKERAKAKYRKKEFKYLFVPEYHKSGTIHFHGIIGDDYVPELVRAEKAKRETYNFKSWDFGFSMINKIKSKKRVSSYISKYITKELLDSPVGKNKRKYWASKNLSLPQIKLVSKDINNLSNSFEVAFDSSVCEIYELDKKMTKELIEYIEK